MDLQGVGSGELALEVVLLESLDVRVAANVLLVDEDVGHAALAGHLGKSVLNIGTVIYRAKGQRLDSINMLTQQACDLPIWSSSRA